jgi:hypothetical protein
MPRPVLVQQKLHTRLAGRRSQSAGLDLFIAGGNRACGDLQSALAAALQDGRLPLGRPAPRRLEWTLYVAAWLPASGGRR